MYLVNSRQTNSSWHGIGIGERLSALFSQPTLALTTQWTKNLIRKGVTGEKVFLCPKFDCSANLDEGSHKIIVQ